MIQWIIASACQLALPTRALIRVAAVPLLTQHPATVLQIATGDDSGTLVSASHMEDEDGAAGSWLWPERYGHKPAGGRSFSLSCSLPLSHFAFQII